MFVKKKICVILYKDSKKKSSALLLKYVTEREVKMNIRANTPVSFGAIRIPYGHCNQNKKTANVLHKIHTQFCPNGIIGPDYNSLFFKNKMHETLAENYLAEAGISYRRTALADICDQDTRYDWATTGDENVLWAWFSRVYNK